jgi:YbgC/YbaW family acyl-CoA thioester hydrolase
MHEWQSQVRDYEINAYGGVNAGTYLSYMEEARKHFWASLGFDLMAMFKQNLGFVVSRYEIDYHWSLVSGELFVVETVMQRISRLQR